MTPATSPEAKATSDLITTLRNQTIPAAERGTTLHVYIGGVTATFADFATVVNAKLPWFILAIIGLSFLLLVVAFRSLLIPATAAVMNLLAAAASFGVLTAFFQWGWGTDAFGLGQAGPVEAFLPVVTLAILFGLFMDYQVFLVSRMNEEWVGGRRNSVAVRTGQVETARVITAAATIMICVFLTFSFMGSRDVAEFGIGLAAAVALDAFILRTVLVPAMMHLFGDANWWLPGWLDRRLPHLAIEPPEPVPASPVPASPVPVPAIRQPGRPGHEPRAGHRSPAPARSWSFMPNGPGSRPGDVPLRAGGFGRPMARGICRPGPTFAARARWWAIRGGGGSLWRYVLVDVEEVIGIVLPLDLNQPIIVLAVVDLDLAVVVVLHEVDVSAWL